MKVRSKTVCNRKRSANPLKIDPTRTGLMRRAFAAKLKRQFRLLKGQIVRLLVDEDAFGLLEQHPLRNSLTVNAGRFAFRTAPEQVKAFQEWLKRQFASTIRGRTEEQLWQEYINDGFRKGAGRAFDDTRTNPRLWAEMEDKLPHYQGTKEEFLRSAFARPETVEKAQLLAGRTLDELDGVTSEMSLKMSRALTDGLVQGKHPREIARDLNDAVDIGEVRAERIARTELIRAHAEGQIEAFKALGVDELGVAVEWATAQDEAVCDLCAELDGVVLKIDEASGMIPRHPNCRCALIPANVGEKDEEQTKSYAGIRDAISRSLDLEGGEERSSWQGADVELSRSRPKSILNAAERFEAALNVFCPTGEGGGVDPSCGSGGGEHAALPTNLDHVNPNDAVRIAAHVREPAGEHGVAFHSIAALAVKTGWSKERLAGALALARRERLVSLEPIEGGHGAVSKDELAWQLHDRAAGELLGMVKPRRSS